MKRSSRRLPLDREHELADLAEAVTAGHKGRIEPLAIARALKITTSFGNYADAFDGLLEVQDGRFHIYCNLDRVESEGAPRARFTLGHELGHYFIDEHRDALLAGATPSHPSFCDYQSPHLIEVEADCFASNLLMPSSRFAADAKKVLRGLPGIVKLAEAYGTSLTATAVRYLQMNLFPCVVVQWNNSGFHWKRLSTGAYVIGWRKTVEQVAQLPRDSPTGKLIKKPAPGVLECGTTKAAWFPFTDAKGDRNSIIREQAISLGRYGVLTMLLPDLGK